MSRHTSPLERSLAGFTAAVLVISQVSFPPQAEASHLGSSTASAGSVPPPSVSAIQSFQPDLFTGRATTSIPIAVPPGRKGMQPGLALTYSSSARNGWVGVGWGMETGYIERSTKQGAPKYDSTDTFTFMFQGVASDLVKIPDGTYRAKDEGAFLRFENLGASGWEVRDKSGTRYLFGQTVSSQIESLGKVFRWALDKVTDSNGNTVTSSYAKDQGQLYLSQILYTGHEPTAKAAANRMDFTTESRPDVETSYRAGFEVRTAKRLKTIDAKATVSDSLQLAHRYQLAYTQSTRTGRSMLAGVTQIGADGTTALPATLFTYQATVPTYQVTSNASQISSPIWNVQTATIDSKANPPCDPFQTLPWTPTVTQSSGTSGTATFSSGADGSFTIGWTGYQVFKTWTYAYNSSSVTIQNFQSSPNSCMWIDNGQGPTKIPSNLPTVTLDPGWTTIYLVGRHDNTTGSGGTQSYAFPLKNTVTVMNPTKFTAPLLAGDFNGDGLTDLANFTSSSGSWSVSLSRGASFSPETQWLTGFGGTSSTPLLGDWNADGRTDVGVFSGGSWQFATSTGTGFQTGTVSPLTFGSGIPFTGDFNGDGTVDVGTYNNGNWLVALGSGSGFTSTESFLRSLGTWDAIPLTGDFNGDGMTDIAFILGGTMTAAFSNGVSFLPSSTWINNFGTANYTTADFNGDGLTDVAFYDKPAGQVQVALSTGIEFGTPAVLPMTFSLRSSDDHLQVGDFNGDGLADPAVLSGVAGVAELSSSQGAFPDLLSSLANGLGGTTTLQYQPSTSNGTTVQLPFVLPLVTTSTAGDGLGHSYTTNYAYAQGLYDAPSKEFRGFAKATILDGDGNRAITDFHQDGVKKGRPFHTEFKDAAGTVWTKADQTWSDAELFPGVHFVKLAQTDAYTCDGDATCRQVRSRFQYDDSSGNVTRTDEDGEIGVSGDERATVTTYTLNPTAWILNKPSLTQTLNAAGTVVAQRRFYYDGAASTAAPPTTGKLTKEEGWRNLPSAQWLATTLTYDTYGNVLTVIDALNRTTTNTYDTNGVYLTSITNTLGHSRQLVYDPKFGQVTSSTDQNNVTMTTEYDVFGRVTKVIGPNDTSALPTVEYQYDLTTNPSKTVTKTRLQSGQAAVLTAYAFTDGLGRTIQTRAPAEDPAKQVVSGAVEFNAKGQVIKQWVAYLDPVFAGYVAPPTGSLAPPAQYTYDVLGRTLTVTDPDGSASSTGYSDWVATSTDANNHVTKRTNDAYGRLAKVEEINGAATYTTIYGYDTLGNLTMVTDHAANVTTMTYDSLGRKIGMTDPDMGTWTYAYDAVDNLTSQTDARGVTIAYAYDALNRPTQKTYTVPGGSGIANPGTVAYSYDNPAKPFSKSKLTGITDGSGSSGFEYDNLGRLIKESKTVDSTAYTIQRAYDLLGRLTSLTYPDASVATYTYNPQGGVETVTLGPQAIVTDLTYNTAGQVTKIVYGNGVVTDYTYNPQTLRLSDLVTAGPGGTLQDFNYTFDAVGNVTQIQDAVHTGSQSFAYDPLNRLTSASGAYGNFSYAYDPIGNMTSKEGVTMTYGAGAAGPHAVTGLSDGTTLSYDANGNLLNKVKVGQTLASYTWDAENRLVQTNQVPAEVSVPVTLQAGWNFVALPAEAVAISLDDIPGLAQVSRYDGATDTWSHWVNDPEFNQFSTLEPGVGYEVYCTSPTTVTLRGKPIANVSEPLAAGWHLLGATQATEALSLASWLAGVSYSQVKTLTDSTGTLAAATQAEPGKGYWVQVSSASTWMPPEPAVQTTQFVYDGDGGRVKQTTAAGTTTYLGESYEKASDGMTTKYVFAGSQRVAAKLSTGELRFYHGDHLGSSNVITNGSGELVELSENTPFGSLSRHEGTTDVAHKFTGQRSDVGTGLYFYNARYYDPQLGRFISADPLVQNPADPQTFNRYAYCRNNPINLVDPSGYGWFRRFFRAIASAVVAVAAAVVGAVAAVTGNEPLAAAAFKVASAAASYSASQLTNAAIEQISSQIRQSRSNEPGLLDVATGQPIADPVAWAQERGLKRLPIYVNGINTSPENAIKEAKLADALVVYYNPSANIVTDLGESVGELIKPTEIDRQLKRELDRLADAGVPVDITGFSEGTLTLYQIQRLGTRFADGSSIRYLSSVVSKRQAQAVFPRNNVSLQYVPTDWLDPINAIQPDGNPFKIYGGRIGLIRDMLTGFKYTKHSVANYADR